MPINAVLRNNNSLSNSKILVKSIHISGFSSHSSVAEVLAFLQECHQTHNEHWLAHPIELRAISALGGGSPDKSKSIKAASDINISCLFDEDITPPEENSALLDARTTPEPIATVLRSPYSPRRLYYYLEPSKGLNSLFANHGTLLQQIAYLEVMGITDAIARHPGLKVATNWHIFCKDLAKIGIINPALTLNASNNFIAPIKRLHLVHSIFLLDEEISSGLHISIIKNTPHNRVLYINSPEMLELALTHCRPNATLIIDGHWVHDARMTHGVWENATAQEIGRDINRLFVKCPGKIKAIRLLGCESGYLSSLEALNVTFKPHKLRFKSETTPQFHTKPMAEFRDRAIYYCHKKESPFAQTSLANQVIISLSNKENQISVTAAPSYTYPFPTNVKKGQFNIGSNTPVWSGPHMWSVRDSSHEPQWYEKLQKMKSITVSIPSQMQVVSTRTQRASSAIAPELRSLSVFHRSKSCSFIDDMQKEKTQLGWPIKFKSIAASPVK